MPHNTRLGLPARGWRARRSDTRENREGGFTLIELIIVVAILPLVVGAISVALLSVFNSSQQVANGLTASSDEQVSSSIFIRDVQGANWITNGSSAPLDVCSVPAGTSLLLSLSPDDVLNTVASPIENIVSYVEMSNTGPSNTSTILRVTCSGGVGSTATSTRALAHGASAATTVSVVPSALNISTWTAASSVSSVSLNLSEPTRTGSSATNAYTVSASPRTTQSPGQTPTGGFNPILPFQLVGPCPGIHFTGGSGNGSNTSLTIQNGFGGAGSVATTSSQSQCPSITSGSQNASYSAGTQYYNVADPLATLPVPAFPSLTGLGAGQCTATTCTSGVYNTTSTGAYSYSPQHGGTATVTNATFDTSLGPNPGIVVFEVPLTAGSVTFDGGASLTSVTYWFRAGLTIADHSTDTFGAATYIYGTTNGTGPVLQMGTQATVAVPNGSPGLLWYVPPSTVNNASSVSLGPGFSGTLAGAQSPYLFCAIWDASSGTLSFGQGNGGGAGLVSGGIYDPNGSVTIAGGYNLQALYFVVNSLNIQTSAVLATG